MSSNIIEEAEMAEATVDYTVGRSRVIDVGGSHSSIVQGCEGIERICKTLMPSGGICNESDCLRADDRRLLSLSLYLRLLSTGKCNGTRDDSSSRQCSRSQRIGISWKV